MLFKGATIIDGTGVAPFKGDLLIEGKDILEVGSIASQGANIVDVSGKFIMPGMINAHVHITFEGDSPDPFTLLEKETPAMTSMRGARSLRKMLRSGVTFFRDMGGRDHVDIDLRNARNQGIIQGPEFMVAGKVLTMIGGHIWKFGRECDGRDEVRKAAREQLRAGADLIKIAATGGVLTPGNEPGAAQFNFEEIQVAVEEAHKAGKKAAAHAIGTTGILNAIRAGIDSIEHGYFLTDEAIELMLKNGTYLVPTFLGPYATYLGGTKAGIAQFILDKLPLVLKPQEESFRKAYKAGVKIAMGPDSGTPINGHDMTSLEVKRMVECGMSASDAIVCSTKNAADLLGISGRYGTLEKGKASDFLVLGANPLEDMEALRSNIESVYKLGQLVD